MATVEVEIDDLAKLADLISDRDNRDKPPTIENIGQCHTLLIKILGPHASLVYADDDGSEASHG